MLMMTLSYFFFHPQTLSRGKNVRAVWSILLPYLGCIAVHCFCQLAIYIYIFFFFLFPCISISLWRIKRVEEETFIWSLKLGLRGIDYFLLIFIFYIHFQTRVSNIVLQIFFFLLDTQRRKSCLVPTK